MKLLLQVVNSIDKKKCVEKKKKNLLCLRSCTANSGHAAHITESIRMTVTKVPELIAGGVITN